MTPTLSGRWQTRTAMFLTIGLTVSAIFSLIFGSTAFVAALLYLLVFGLVWDVVYIVLQEYRWDRDWPPVFAWLCAIWEAVFLFVLALVVDLPGLPTIGLPPVQFAIHYLTVWTLIFLFIQGPMKALFPFWRFHGGRIVPSVTAAQRRRAR